ncbi:hypothetical protein [Sphingomonas sp.]|uniref:hypothetical protein n=1 Tax=Sphingomonas sp. TaxID=28214 RepID=UPI003B3A648B
MDLLSMAAETGSIEELIDPAPQHDPGLMRVARAIGIADAERGVRVARHPRSFVARLRSLVRRSWTPLADPVLEALRRDAFEQRRAALAKVSRDAHAVPIGVRSGRARGYGQ